MTTDWDAPAYESRGAFVWEMPADLLDLLRPATGERILDVGCGTGHLAARIAECGASVLAIDSSPSMVELARRNYPAIRFELLDVLEMRLRSEFDAVFSNATLHWVTRPEEAAARIFDALKPGGRFVEELGGRGNIAMIVSALLAARKEGNAPAVAELPWYFPGEEEYSALLERRGFQIESARLFPRSTPFGEGEGALVDWLEMFARPLLDDLTVPLRTEVLGAVERRLRPVLYRDGRWEGDYVRLRVKAWKCESNAPRTPREILDSWKGGRLSTSVGEIEWGH